MPHKIRKLQENKRLCVLGDKFIAYAITSTYSFRGDYLGRLLFYIEKHFKDSRIVLDTLPLFLYNIDISGSAYKSPGAFWHCGGSDRWGRICCAPRSENGRHRNDISGQARAARCRAVGNQATRR